MKTVADALHRIERQLEKAGVEYGQGTDCARDEAGWLLCGALALPFEKLADAYGRELSAEEIARVEALVRRRIRERIPTAYLLNEAWFAGLSFYVDERVLIPRSLFGEFILDRFQPWIGAMPVRRALDLCTGSGCIAIALAQTFADASIDAADISADALAVAQKNKARHGNAANVNLIRSDLFVALHGPYDLIVSNPPYVDAATMRHLPPEFAREPALALASGDDGLNAVETILREAHRYLAPRGYLFVETGNSHAALQEKYPAIPFTWLATRHGDESVFMLTAEECRRATRVIKSSPFP